MVDEQLAVEPEDVEGDERHGRLRQQAGGWLADVHPPLEALEAGLTLVVERDDLAVEDRAVRGEGAGEAGQLRVGGRDVAPPPVQEGDAGGLDHPDHPLPVELGLEQPTVGAGGHAVPAGEHG